MTKATSLRVGIVLLAALAALFLGQSAGYAEGEGVIAGKVENKTLGGGTTAGLQVTLQTIAHQSDGGTATATTDTDGNFRFERLTVANNFAYVIGLQYSGVEYGSDFIVFDEGESSQNVDLAVFETTDKADNITFQSGHIVLGAPYEPDKTLPVMEIVIANNSGDRVYVPAAGKGSVEFILPAGFQNLQREPELDASASDFPGGFAYNEPLRPGMSQFLFQYEVPYGGSSLALNHPYAYPIQLLNVLVPAQGIKVSSPMLQSQQTRNINGQDYIQLSGTNLPKGASVVVQLEGLPTPSFLSSIPEAVRWGALAVAGAAFVGLIGFVLIRRRSTGGRAATYDDYDDEGYDEDAEEDDLPEADEPASAEDPATS